MPDTNWPYDPAQRAELARRLYALLPALYRIQDAAPEGKEDLRKLIEILAGPLAAVRQNVNELHADLFIDTSGEAALPLLAEMVGTSLVFSDVDRNRLDVRGTVRWRRRKGTPPMLQEMAEELLGRQAPLVEGWKLCQVDQDLDILRLDRVLPDIRARVIAESVDGPWDGPYHAVDLRVPARRTGRRHPRHVTWYVHPTRLFPLSEGTPAFVGDLDGVLASDGDGVEPLTTGAGALGDATDWRYAFHPLGEDWPLRARRTSTSDTVRTDRIGSARFADTPGDTFGVDGRFSVRVCGLVAAVGAASDTPRDASDDPADLAVARNPTAKVLEYDGAKLVRDMTVELLTAPVDGTGLAADLTSPTQCARVTFATSGVTTTTLGAPAGGDAVVLVRLGATGNAYFPGATILFEGTGDDASVGRTTGDLSSEGALLGAIVCVIPAGWVTDERFWYLGADGTLVDAFDGDGNALPMLDDGAGGRLLDLDNVSTVGPGPAWPPLDPTASTEQVGDVVGAPGRGPVVLHGGRVVRDNAGTWEFAGGEHSLVFALRSAQGGVVTVRPMVRLRWSGDDPSAAEWSAVDDTGVDAVASDRYAELAAWIEDDEPQNLTLVVRFESDQADAVLTPAEVAWTSDSGAPLLVHLPQQPVAAFDPNDEWDTDEGTWPNVGTAYEVHADGSTWSLTGGWARYAAGAVAPIRESTYLLRRRVGGRALCPWRNEDPGAGELLAATADGFLDVDVTHGLFAFAPGEPPQPWSAESGVGAPANVPPNVTVDYEDGRTDHIGAMPAAREPELDLRQPDPTRIVSRSGSLGEDADPTLHALPRYRSVAEALAACSAATEVVQIVDSATYPDETLVFPAACTDLTVQAAERCRPVIRLAAPVSVGTAAYTALTLRGLTFADDAVTLPETEAITVQFCTFATDDATLSVDLSDGTLTCVASLLAGLTVTGRGAATLSGCVVDGNGATYAIDAQDASLELDRVTVLGDLRVHRIEASECIFDGAHTIRDRFAGCVRYSRVAALAGLPRNYRCADGTTLRFVSRARYDAAYARLHEACEDAVVKGAEDGGEMGAFHDAEWGPLLEAVRRRLSEYTPAGLRAGLVRMD